MQVSAHAPFENYLELRFIFQWKDMNPGVRPTGGLFDGRGPAIVLRYETCGGLFNQHYCQLAGLTMAAALGAQAVVLPPALARNK